MYESDHTYLRVLRHPFPAGTGKNPHISSGKPNHGSITDTLAAKKMPNIQYINFSSGLMC
jgi:hypothetical protein